MSKMLAAELLDDYIEVATNLDKDIEAKLFEAEKLENSNSQDPKGPPKRNRNRLSYEASAYLDSLFKICSHPTRTERRAIGEHLGISLHQVTQWFTNRRFREPKVGSPNDGSTHMIPSPMTSPECVQDEFSP